jgi:hypothetical protein
MFERLDESASKMNWEGIAATLAERHASPVAVVGATGRLFVANQAFRRLLGLAPEQLPDEDFVDEWVPASETPTVRWMLEASLRGELARLELPLLTAPWAPAPGADAAHPRRRRRGAGAGDRVGAARARGRPATDRRHRALRVVAPHVLPLFGPFNPQVLRPSGAA